MLLYASVSIVSSSKLVKISKSIRTTISVPKLKYVKIVD